MIVLSSLSPALKTNPRRSALRESVMPILASLGKGLAPVTTSHLRARASGTARSLLPAAALQRREICAVAAAVAVVACASAAVNCLYRPTLRQAIDALIVIVNLTC